MCKVSLENSSAAIWPQQFHLNTLLFSLFNSDFDCGCCTAIRHRHAVIRSFTAVFQMVTLRSLRLQVFYTTASLHVTFHLLGTDESCVIPYSSPLLQSSIPVLQSSFNWDSIPVTLTLVCKVSVGNPLTTSFPQCLLRCVVCAKAHILGLGGVFHKMCAACGFSPPKVSFPFLQNETA